MNRLSTADRVRVVTALVEGNNIRATTRMTGVAKNTIVKLLADLGAACQEYQDRVFHNLPCKRIECAEIPSFVGAKQKNVPQKNSKFGSGEVSTWTAICADTNLVPSWAVGDRTAGTARSFILDLADRLPHRVQLTTAGCRVHLEAIEGDGGGEIDYAILIRAFGSGARRDDAPYTTAVSTGIEKSAISGAPDMKHLSMSHVGRQNLTTWMDKRHLNRLEKHMYAVALHFMHHNFCRVHKSLRVTPAMAASVTDHAWEISEMVSLL